MPCSVRMPSAQRSESVTPPRPTVVEAGAARVVGADLEARREDQAVELVVHAAGPHAGLVDALDALAVGVDEVRARLVVRLQVLVVEARPLAELAVPGLQRLGGRGIARRSRPRARGSRSSSRRRCPRTPRCMSLGVELAPGSPIVCTTRSRMRCEMSVQPSFTRSSSAKPPVCSVAKLMSHFRCQPGSSVGEPLRIDRVVVADVDRRRRALEHEELAARPARACGMHCTAVAPVPMMPTRLSASFVIGAPAGSPPVYA